MYNDGSNNKDNLPFYLLLKNQTKSYNNSLADILSTPEFVYDINCMGVILWLQYIISLDDLECMMLIDIKLYSCMQPSI